MKVAIIGNGDLTTDHSSLIDGCDCVIRMNLCRGFSGPYGEKLDCLALCNTGEVALSAMDPTHNRFIQRASRVILSRNPALYTEIGEAFKGQPASVFFEEYSHLATKPGFKHAQVRSVDYEIGHALLGKLMSYGGEPFAMPSTGMRVIEEVIHNPGILELDEPISAIFIAGFSHEGWPGHPWKAERSLIDHYADQGLVTRLG